MRPFSGDGSLRAHAMLPCRQAPARHLTNTAAQMEIATKGRIASDRGRMQCAPRTLRAFMQAGTGCILRRWLRKQQRFGVHRDDRLVLCG